LGPKNIAGKKILRRIGLTKFDRPKILRWLFVLIAARRGINRSVDNYAGGSLATQHLLDQGCLHIGHISGPLDWWEARQRKQAWQETLKKAGIKAADNHWKEGNWSPASGEAAFEQLLQSYPEMDAVFVANDQMALSVLRNANRRAIRIPQNLAVVGFDNFAESAYFWPALTTINHNHHELGCRAVQEVVKQIEADRRNEKIEAQTVLLLTELVVRESTLVQERTPR
jgi:LacI family transcriptional regulator